MNRNRIFFVLHSGPSQISFLLISFCLTAMSFPNYNSNGIHIPPWEKVFWKSTALLITAVCLGIAGLVWGTKNFKLFKKRGGHVEVGVWQLVRVSLNPLVCFLTWLVFFLSKYSILPPQWLFLSDGPEFLVVSVAVCTVWYIFNARSYPAIAASIGGA